LRAYQQQTITLSRFAAPLNHGSRLATLDSNRVGIEPPPERAPTSTANTPDQGTRALVGQRRPVAASA
jgi:hypothetical protein